MNHVHRAFLSIACLAPFFSSTLAHAQAADVAKKLLEEAKTQKEAGKLSQACTLLDRAYELDAKDGILFARADCRDQERKIVAAVSLYEAYLRSYSRMTGASKRSHAERAATAEARLTELRPLVPMVKFVWASPPPPETKIIVDQVEYSASTLDVRLPLEPGTHEIVVIFPGQPERPRTVTLAEGGSTIVDLTPVEAKTDEEPQKPGGKSNSPKSRPAGAKAKSQLDPSVIAGFAGVGLGAAGFIAGGITGGMAISEKKIVDANCNDVQRCNHEGLAAAKRFQTVGNVSTASIVAGGIFGAVGATLLLVAYRSPSSSSASTAKLNATVTPGNMFLI